MQREERLVYYDPDLEIEACYFKGIVQRFPEHFHQHYVVGAIESGRRCAVCAGERLLIEPGDLVIFNPRQTHACHQVGEYPLDWRCLNVSGAVMERAVGEITGTPGRPLFSKPVLYHSELAGLVREVFELIAREEREFEKEEAFLLLIESLLTACGGYEPPEEETRSEIRAVCAYLEEHCAARISLDALAAVAGLSRSHLIRCFTRQKGISPFRYLETVRVDRARRLLEQGVRPAEAALDAGFSDQSHFTNHFKALTGLTPSQYRGVFCRRGGEAEQ